MPRILLIVLFISFFIPGVFCQQKKPIQKPMVRQVSGPSFNVKDDPAPIKYIQLKKDTPIFVPQNYYIRAIEDQSHSNDSIGYILQPKSGNRQRVSFSNGAADAVKEYFDFKIAKDTTLVPLVFIIKKLALSEEKKDDYRMGMFQYDYSFEYRYADRSMPIGSENGHFSYTTHLTQNRRLDSNITQVFIFNLKDIDSNLAEAKKNDPVFCKGVQAVVSRKMDNVPASDTLFYNPQQDIMWEDFVGASGAENYFLPQMGILLIPNISYKDGMYQLKVKTGAYFIRSRSWVGKNAKSTMLLYHIQYRFKLAWLASEKLKEQLETSVFTCSNYETEVRTIFEKANKLLLRTFDEYITQTLSGGNKKEQNRWQALIDKEIEEIKK
jgi:hypothetical protein